MEKLPKSDDLQIWLDEFVQKDTPPTDYDKMMARLAVKLAEKGRKISSGQIQKVQAAVKIRELTDIITKIEE